MKKYKFVGFAERVYHDIVDRDNKTLVAKPGDVVEFNEKTVPTDGQWVPADQVKAPKVKDEAAS